MQSKISHLISPRSGTRFSSKFLICNRPTNTIELIDYFGCLCGDRRFSSKFAHRNWTSVFLSNSWYNVRNCSPLQGLHDDIVAFALAVAVLRGYSMNYARQHRNLKKPLVNQAAIYPWQMHHVRHCYAWNPLMYCIAVCSSSYVVPMYLRRACPQPARPLTANTPFCLSLHPDTNRLDVRIYGSGQWMGSIELRFGVPVAETTHRYRSWVVHLLTEKTFQRKNLPPLPTISHHHLPPLWLVNIRMRNIGSLQHLRSINAITSVN